MDFSYLDDWMEQEAGGEAIEEGGEGYRNIWVLAGAVGGPLLPAALEAMGQARELADQIGVYVYGLLLGGDEVEAIAEELPAYGADKVLVAADPALAEYQPALYVQALAALVERFRPEILLIPATPLGNDLAPALAARLNTGLMSHCVKLGLDMSERLLVGTYPVLGGEVYNTAVCAEARPQMATLEPGYFRAPYQDASRSGSIEQVEVELGDAATAPRLQWLDAAAPLELPPVPLSRARIVVGAGRGLGDAEGFRLAQQLAEALGGVVAGSRGALDEGWIGEEQVVGIGGHSVAPALYIACGISGDIYHYFGAQDSKFVVAINRDEKAPIMKRANMAIAGDARQVIPAMLKALKA